MAGEKPQMSPDSTERKVPLLKVTLDRSKIKTGKVEGLFPKKDQPILDKNNSRRTYSGESHTDDKDSWISWPQAVAIASSGPQYSISTCIKSQQNSCNS